MLEKGACRVNYTLNSTVVFVYCIAVDHVIGMYGHVTRMVILRNVCCLPHG